MSYIGRYERFIASLKHQDVNGAFEMHHIVPRSMGGSDDKNNLIKLTPRQHYIAHWILWKIHKGKMAHAFFFMNNLSKSRRIGSKGYEKLRLDALQSLSGENAVWYGKKFPEQMRKNQSKARERYLKKDGVLDSIRKQFASVRPSAEDYRKSSKTMSELIWINDGVRSYRVKPDVAKTKLENGFVYGRVKNYINESYKAMRKEIANKQWSAVKLAGHTGNLIKV